MLVEDAWDRLTELPFRARPLRAFQVRTGEKTREIHRADRVESLIERAALTVIDRALGPRLLDCVHGYRIGRSIYSAAAAVRDLLAAGNVHVLRTDIRDFFPSVDWDLLDASMRAVLPAPLVPVLSAFMRAPVLRGMEEERRQRGLPLGRAISPSLSNVFLLDLDGAVAAVCAGYVRYGDDIVMAAPTAARIDAARDTLSAALARQGLEANPSKTRQFVFDGTPMTYLGLQVTAEGVLQPMSDPRLARILMEGLRRATAASEGAQSGAPEAERADPPNRRTQTLYVVTPGTYLSAAAGMVRVSRGRETLREIPVRRIDRVLILAGAAVSSGFVTECLNAGVPVVFWPPRARVHGVLSAADAVSPLRRRAQFDLYADAARRLPLARSIVVAKIDAMIGRGRRRGGAPESRERLRGLRVGALQAPDADVLRGCEGAASAFHYQSFATWIAKPGFEFRGRTRRPPRDPINSLLSFAYTLLFAEVLDAVLACGLDPYPGLLHDVNRRHPALVSDLMEPYRVLVGDTFVLQLVNSGAVDAAGFETRAGGAVLMAAHTKRTVVDGWEAYVTRPYGPSMDAGSPRRLILAAARSMLSVVLGERDDLDLPLRWAEVDPTEGGADGDAADGVRL